MRMRSGVGMMVTVLSVSASLPALADFTVQTFADRPQQTVEGWGASLAHWSANARVLYAGDAFRNAYRDLGLNILRVDMQKETLVTSSTDFATPITLADDLAANIGKMNFTRASTAAFGNLAQWLRSNALEPDQVRITGSLWSPPHWMKGPTGFTQTFNGMTPRIATPFLSGEYLDPANPVRNGDSVGGRLRTEDATNVDQYGKYIASWVKGFEQAYGVDMHAISLQNESSFENPFNSMTFTKNAQGRDDFNQYAVALAGVKKAWDDFGLDTKVMGPHIAGFGTASDPANLWRQNEMIKGVKNASDKTLIDFLDYYNANFYNGTSENSVKAIAGFYHGGDTVDPNQAWGSNNYGKPPGVKHDGKGIWYSETGGENDGWPSALTVALKMHNALVHSNASAYVYWQLADGNNNISEHTLLGTNQLADPESSKKYAAFKQFSRFIRPGAVRLDATFADGNASTGGAGKYDGRSGLNISAFYEDREERLTYVLINAMTTAQNITLELPEGLSLETIQAYRTSATESFDSLGDLQLIDGKLIYSAPAQSVTTLTGIVPEPGAMGLFLGGGSVVLFCGRRAAPRAS